MPALITLPVGLLSKQFPVAHIRARVRQWVRLGVYILDAMRNKGTNLPQGSFLPGRGEAPDPCRIDSHDFPLACLLVSACRRVCPRTERPSSCARDHATSSAVIRFLIACQHRVRFKAGATGRSSTRGGPVELIFTSFPVVGLFVYGGGGEGLRVRFCSRGAGSGD